jgi:hypothetical protein
MSRRAELALWLTLALVQLAPVWGLRYFPSQDGASHVENAAILLHLARGDAPVFHDYFMLGQWSSPNWLGHLLLAGLMAIAGPLAAEKMLLTAYLIGLPLAVRAAMRALRPESAPLAVLSVPLLYHCLLHYGFYNFCLSLVLFFVVLAYGLRGGRTPGLAALLLLLYGCHIISWGLALVALAVLAPRAIARLALASLPSVAAAVWFVAGRGVGAAEGPIVTAAQRWKGLWHFSPMVFSYAEGAQWLGAACALALAAAAAVAMVRSHAVRLALLSAVVLGLYFVAPPAASGGAVLLERLNLYFFLTLLPWVASAPWGRTGMRCLSGGALIFTLALAGLNWPWYLAADRLLLDFMSAAPVVRSNTTFVPLVYDPRGPGPLRDLYGEPLRHAAGHLAAARSAVNLDNYEAQTDLFPVRFRGDRNPGVFVGAMEENPPRVRLDSPWIDAVLVWDPARTAPAPMGFAPVFTSPAGYLRLYERPRPQRDGTGPTRTP